MVPAGGTKQSASNVTRESIPLKPNKDMFYHQQQQNNSFSDYGNEMGDGDDDIQMLENEHNNKSQQ